MSMCTRYTADVIMGRMMDRGIDGWIDEHENYSSKT